MIDQFYLNLYPVLTQEWRDLGEGFGLINYDIGVPTSSQDLTARVYIHVGNNWASVNLEVRHRIHGVATVSLGDAKQPAMNVWRLVDKDLPTLEEQVQQMYETWAEQLALKFG